MHLLIVQTARRRYAVRHDDVAALRVVAGPDDLAAPDPQGRPYVGAELGPLLDPGDVSTARRRHALVVPLRRRSVALLADAVELLAEGAAAQPLPPVLRSLLAEPWAVGAVEVAGELIVQIDLRAVARSALLRSGGPP